MLEKWKSDESTPERVQVVGALDSSLLLDETDPRRILFTSVFAWVRDLDHVALACFTDKPNLVLGWVRLLVHVPTCVCSTLRAVNTSLWKRTPRNDV